ncbi:MAG: (2Fe-2S)-binding protein [Anaerolineae bacterium]|nr:(2Fe-2S)-binding protein [Anaerolineae bacterium]
MTTYSLRVNGEQHVIEADPNMPLLWVLRDILGLTGTKYSCGIGLCGSCTVHLDGQTAQSCTTKVESSSDREITTIEGLAEDISHPVQKTWIAENVNQCGYCQPGQIMAAAALLASNPNPSDAEIIAAMSANLCRCGTYQRIRLAIQRAAREASQL